MQIHLLGVGRVYWFGYAVAMTVQSFTAAWEVTQCNLVISEFVA